MTMRVMRRAFRVGIAAVSLVACAIADAALAQQASLPVHAYEQIRRRFDYLWGLANPYVAQKADFFGGIDAAKATNFVWMGATYAPIGTLAEDGWRVRFMGGAGLYSYLTSAAPMGINDAYVFSGELLGGYRKTFSNVLGRTVYVGAFAGLHYEDQILVYDDQAHPARGSEAGLKASLEIYSRVWERYVVTGFGSLSTVHEKYYAKGSLLYELNEMWALGGELATMGDARYREYRAGFVGALTWQKKIISLAAGALDNSGRGSGTYLTLSVYSPF